MFTKFYPTISAIFLWSFTEHTNQLMCIWLLPTRRMQITTFLKSNLCERILASKNVSREFRFAMNINASEVVFDIKPEFSNEKIMLQGAIDCVFEEKDNLIVVDYKTDKIISSETLKKQYAQQLELYARALRECTGKNVKEKVLYSFYTGTQIFL